MKRFLSRRNFIQSGALMATACAASGATQSFAQALPETGKPLPIKLGICSYTFRNFTRAQMLGYLKDLRLADLNVKDTKDHLPMDPTLEAQALADYAAAGIKLHAAGTIYFPSSGESDIRGKFEYCKRAGIDTIVAVRQPPPEEVDQDITVVSPCGACRELIFDYDPKARVIVPTGKAPAAVPIGELLPNKYRRGQER